MVADFIDQKWKMLMHKVLELPLWNCLLFPDTRFKPNHKQISCWPSMLPRKVLTVQNRYLMFIIFLQVRSVMIDNIDKVLERGDRLELLVDKTANMQGNTVRFKRQARRFRNTVWWRNVKLTYVIFWLNHAIIFLHIDFFFLSFLPHECYTWFWFLSFPLIFFTLHGLA